jgi:SAM-dependent methyltransferase
MKGESNLVVNMYIALTRASPFLRKHLWKGIYQFIASVYGNPDWTFMNYGYAPTASEEDSPALDAADEPDRSFIQLYHHVLGGVSIEGKDVLEVGCGRGGGSSWMRRYGKPRSLYGVDLSPKAIGFCRRRHVHEGLSFVTGDAEALPFPDGSFDTVVNVESSHCYPRLDRFLAEARRVLRPGGRLHIADIYDNEGADWFRSCLHGCGMDIEREDDISANIVEAMRQDGLRRLAMFQRTLPSVFVRWFREFAGDADSAVFRRFKESVAHYIGCVLAKAPVIG